MSAPLVVVGLDPGLANLGLGAVRELGREVTLLGSALVRTSPRSPQAERLLALYQATEAFILAHRPGALVIEGQYFHQQRDLAFKVGQAVGVALLAAARHGVPVFEYGPLQVKQALVGSGRASKAQVTFMVRAMLRLPHSPDSHHVADALALALTHLSYRRLQEAVG
ncbi:MAG: crossover junction endodeoxyribonuclease RuvC [Truepera sp.]|nr:crossover junction endodeoxyribonuclease RuvC [Truepera sp.]